MSSVQKGCVKLQCLLCLLRRNLTCGLSKIPEIGVGWMYRRHSIASDMSGWGMLWNASANGTRKSLWMEQMEQNDLSDVRLICWQFFLNKICWQFICRGIDIWLKYNSWGSYSRKYNWSELLSYCFKSAEWCLSGLSIQSNSWHSISALMFILLF